MTQREEEKIIEICRAVDLLVTENPGSSNWEVLEGKRLQMNDLLMAGNLGEAEKTALCITLLWSGQTGQANYFEQSF